MKILIIRHAEPDYSIDSLTQKGWKEADFLSEKLAKLDIKDIYVSTMGRAKATAKATLEKLGKTATECDWLREFDVCINKPNQPKSIPWDWLPYDWTKTEEFYSYENWLDTPVMKESEISKKYKEVTGELDKVIKEHGYERDGKIYKAVRPNNDTIALFCHFGLECVLLSHLLSISPMVLWHNFCALPSSVTTVVTEERRKGIASFRMNGFGDISHLYAKGEAPSFSARFSECYFNEGERLD